MTTYRNDHEAAVTRAETLQAELQRIERERDRLRAELATGSQSGSATRDALTSAEFDRLVWHLEGEVRNTNVVAIVWMICGVTAMAVAMIVAIAGALKIGVLVGLLGLIALLAWVFAQRTSSYAVSRPVIDAIRYQPEQIVSVTMIGGGGRGHLLVVRTTDHHLRLITDHGPWLLAALRRRCPNVARSAL